MHDSRIPLVVDIDGSLLRSDLLLECLWAALGNNFFLTLKIIVKYLLSPARLKRAILDVAQIDISKQPLNPDVIAYCEKARDDGRRVVFASGSDQKLIDQLAERTGFAGPHYASDGVQNLTGAKKAEVLVEAFGKYNFEYIGNSTTDLYVWKVAHSIVAVAPSKKLYRQIENLGRAMSTLGDSWKFSDLIRGIRPYQWVKNLLLLVPALAAHSIEPLVWVQVVIGIASFSAAASAIYIVNDLLDLAADRSHPRKKHRPFASGAMPISIGMATSVALGIGALAVGALASPAFAAIAAVYMATSLAYSLRLKRMRWIDIFVLAWLYTLRVLAGSLAAGITLSGWLIVFVFAAFLSLGAVKRLTELAKATNDRVLPGRGYSRSDMGDLYNISVMAVVIAIAIFLAYSFSPAATALYTNLWALRLVSLPMAAWMLRMVFLARDGKQDYDPIVFASKDIAGLALVVVSAVLIFVAI